ncbi:50S ribosomal protein L10 [candidate division WOR-3 bacterium JGI_Cruoil_03_51_56]|mgnify:CR=1 FL=1|uniref:Large ribosomal subunit protein uL10 n=1 Tax=candidate division WOR-3 bacterium JGI_Cruoil_03_51_56 TaxID=1973747 RepID=A0A235BQQ4_UNCW3|nr:MAG: 50S ribosomal protein L10 [candidate division WOR-3 bacterium JGI_Cruoil_03_51_56]
MPKEEKAEKVARLKEQVSQASAFYFLDFTKVGANEFNTLRRSLRKAGATIKVVKNRLALRALDQSGFGNEVADFLHGPTSLVLAAQDPIAPARIIKEMAGKLRALKVKGAYVDDAVYPAEQFGFLASLPTKDELRGQVVGTLASPVWELASGLERITSEFVYVLDQLKGRKESMPTGS